MICTFEVRDYLIRLNITIYKGYLYKHIKSACKQFLVYRHKKTPPVGLEPTTLRLTAACSTD